MRNDIRRRKRRRRRRIAAFFITVLMFILLGVIIAGIVYFIKNHQTNKLTGTWEYKINYTDYVTFSVDDWLSEKSDEKPMFTPVSILLTLSDDDTYTAAVDEASYRGLEQEVRRYLDDRFAGIVSNELLLSGYMGSDNLSDVSHMLVNETIGESLYDYLEGYGIKFMPSYDDIVKYCSNGTYEYDKKNGTIKFMSLDGVTREEKISTTDDILVLTENDASYPITFSRK